MEQSDHNILCFFLYDKIILSIIWFMLEPYFKFIGINVNSVIWCSPIITTLTVCPNVVVTNISDMSSRTRGTNRRHGCRFGTVQYKGVGISHNTVWLGSLLVCSWGKVWIWVNKSYLSWKPTMILFYLPMWSTQVIIHCNSVTIFSLSFTLTILMLKWRSQYIL